MRRWGDGQGKHLTETERDEIHRRIVAGKSFVKVRTDTKRAVQSILEGGEVAFLRRKEIYGH